MKSRLSSFAFGISSRAWGGTIDKHQAIANTRGSVWWGWWHKGGERVPKRVFKHLRVGLRSASTRIFLLDSNRGWLYAAQVVDIVWSSKEIPSPRPDATPAYYRKKRCLAWFKISELKRIEKNVNSFLQALTYVRVDEFLEDTSDAYRALDGKRVSSASELIQQNHSIWFLRDASGSVNARPRGRATGVHRPVSHARRGYTRMKLSAPPRGKVKATRRLFDARRGSVKMTFTVTPNFPERAVKGKSNTLLWLSDLHFWAKPDLSNEARRVAELAATLINVPTRTKSKARKAQAIAKKVAGELRARLKDRIARNTTRAEAREFGVKLRDEIRKVMGRGLGRSSARTTTGAYSKRLVQVLPVEVARVFVEHVRKNGATKAPQPQHDFDNPVLPSRDPSPPRQLSEEIHTVLGVGGSGSARGPKIKLAGVIVSGDLTWQSLPQEFDQAYEFIDKLADPFGLEGPSEKFNWLAVCPGNHDVPFSDDSADPTSPIINWAPGQAKKAYANFYRKLFGLKADEHLACGRRYRLRNRITVEVACINSSALEQHEQRFQGHGFVGAQQLKQVARGMLWNGARRKEAIRVLVVHHPITPVQYSIEPQDDARYQTFLDAEALVQWVIDHRVDVLLHGHMHEAFRVTLTRGKGVKDNVENDRQVIVLGNGSAGVISKHRPKDTPTMMATLEFTPERLKVQYYRLRATGIEGSSDGALEFPLAQR